MKHRILTQCTAKDLNSHGDATSPGPRMDSNHSSSYGRDYGIVDNCVPVTVAREILQKQLQDKTSLNRSISQLTNAANPYWSVYRVNSESKSNTIPSQVFESVISELTREMLHLHHQIRFKGFRTIFE